MRSAVVALAVCLAAALATGDAGAAPRGPSGTIVFAADRAALWDGEVYRVGLDGRRVDLSRSAALDVGPAVSPDGRLVAFASNRGGHVALYTVQLDGAGLRRVSPFLFALGEPSATQASISWSRDGRRLAALVTGDAGRPVSLLWSGDLAGRGRIVARGAVFAAGIAPDGRAVAYQDTVGRVTVVTPAGRRILRAVAFRSLAAWSATGRLVLGEPGGVIQVLDERGRRLASFPGRTFVWSPDGSGLASVAGSRLQVRRGGLGSPVLDVPLPPHALGATQDPADIQWLGNHRLRVSVGDGWIGYDLRTGEPWTPPKAFAAFQYPPVVSRDGTKTVSTADHGTAPVALLRIATTAGEGPVLIRAPSCGDDTPFVALQFTPDGGSLVYESGCPEPSADLWSVAADGTGLRRLTDTPTDETAPSVSPDGARVAYVQQAFADRCKGCPTTIWTMSRDGSGRRALTAIAPDASAWDSSPSFSPDGATILFWHSTIDSFGRLVEIPAVGGAGHDLPIAGGYPAWGPARIAYLTDEPALRTSLPDGSGAVTVSRGTSISPASLAWSRDGRLGFLSLTRAGGLRLAVVTGTQVVYHPLAGLRPAPRGSGLAWSPDGTRLVLSARDTAGVCDLWTVEPDGTQLRRLTHGVGALGRLSWISPRAG